MICDSFAIVFAKFSTYYTQCSVVFYFSGSKF